MKRFKTNHRVLKLMPFLGCMFHFKKHTHIFFSQKAFHRIQKYNDGIKKINKKMETMIKIVRKLKDPFFLFLSL